MFLVDPEILRRIEPVGVLDRIRTSQARVLRTLLNSARLARLVEQEAIEGDAAYAPTDFLADLRGGLWRELAEVEVEIDAYRRNVQRTYLDLIDDRLNGPSPAEGDARPFLRGELRALDRSIAAKLAHANLERHARTGRRFFKNQPKRQPGQPLRRSPWTWSRLQFTSDLEKSQDMMTGNGLKREQIFPQPSGG